MLKWEGEVVRAREKRRKIKKITRKEGKSETKL